MNTNNEHITITVPGKITAQFPPSLETRILNLIHDLTTSVSIPNTLQSAPVVSFSDEERVLNLLRTGKKTGQELSKALGLKPDARRKLLTRLKKEKKIVMKGERTKAVYSLA